MKTLFQTAQENPYSLNTPESAASSPSAPRRGYHDFDVAAIVQLHAEPDPDYVDTFQQNIWGYSGSVDPETALLLKEELAHEACYYFDNDGITEYIEEVAPTTENIRHRRGRLSSQLWEMQPTLTKENK